jgi:ABC-2 type transport system ATP-binding protein
VIETSELGKAYGRVRALDDVSLRIDEGVVALLGRNGAGKSTLLSILAGLLRETEGSIEYRGERLGAARKTLREAVTLLPQTLELDPAVSARVFVRYLLNLRGRSDDGLDRILDTFGLTAVADRPLGTLSGGLRQRVGLAYAFAMATPVLLLDEPTQGLDPVERLTFCEELARAAAGRTIVYSTHVVSDVDAVASRVIVLDAGRLLFDGTPDVLRADVPAVYAGVVDQAALEKLRERRALTAIRRIDAEQFAVRWFGDKTFADAECVEPMLVDAYVALISEVR